jgi:hypothetical protein
MSRCLLACGFFAWTCAAGTQIVLDAGTTLLIDSREPLPIRKAARDLARDMQTVFGRAPRVVEEPRAASETVIAIAFSHNLPVAVRRPVGWERLRIQATEKPWPGARVRRAVVMTGSDVRGTIYAIYEFSRRFLNVDPLYWWTDHPPVRCARVVVPGGFTVEPPSPTFRYRGWFINDEDLLTAWRPGTAERSGISLETWDHLYESLLRLKGDMIIPTTFIFPDEPQTRAAGERGLVISQHHMEPLGLNVYQWPKDVPYSLERLFAAWRCAVSQYAPGQEVVWTVGLRGRYDRPFWPDIPDAPRTAEGRARMIREAIDKQIEMVRKQWPHAHPEFILNSWMEGSGLLRGGALDLPPEVIRVWADNGRGTIQDGGKMRAGEGVYYHTAVVGGNGNNFTERVPVECIARELGRAAKAGATRYMLLNPANIRPVAMTTRAVMDLAWDARRWTDAARDPGGEFLDAWSREEFGAEAAPLAVQYYKAYFDAPARYGSATDATISDEFEQWCARDLLLRILQGDASSPVRFRFLRVRDTAAYGARVTEICRQAEPRWERARMLAEQALARVPPARRDFFRAHALTQVQLRWHANRMLGAIAEAASPGLGNSAKLEKIDRAVASLHAIQTALRDAEYGQWAGFYSLGDWFVDIPLTLRLAEACRTRLAGRALSPTEQKTLDTAARINREDTSYVYIKIKAYQKGRQVEFCEPPASR